MCFIDTVIKLWLKSLNSCKKSYTYVITKWLSDSGRQSCGLQVPELVQEGQEHKPLRRHPRGSILRRYLSLQLLQFLLLLQHLFLLPPLELQLLLRLIDQLTRARWLETQNRTMQMTVIDMLTVGLCLNVILCFRKINKKIDKRDADNWSGCLRNLDDRQWFRVNILVKIARANFYSSSKHLCSDTLKNCPSVTFSVFFFSKYLQVAKPPTVTKYTQAPFQFYTPFTAVSVQAAYFQILRRMCCGKRRTLLHTTLIKLVLSSITPVYCIINIILHCGVTRSPWFNGINTNRDLMVSVAVYITQIANFLYAFCNSMLL